MGTTDERGVALGDAASPEAAARDASRPAWVWRLMLLSAAAIWGGSFMILKGALDSISPGWLIAFRFIVSGCVLAVVFRRRLAANLDGSHLLAGAVVGVSGGLGYLIQNMGLVDTTPSNNAFLTAVYCVMVPFLSWGLTRRRPRANNFVAALLCLAGVGFVSLGDSLTFSLRWGDWMTLLGAACFAVQIVQLDRLAPGHDVCTLTVVDVFAMGLVSLVKALLTEPVPAVQVTGDLVFQMLYVTLLSSCVCSILQNVGQSHVPPTQASILLSLESVFGVLFSVLFYGDPLTWRLMCGFALIFLAVILSEVSPRAVAQRVLGRASAGREA
ncbi:DMT family transporter [Olsenella sp. YH-ols2223]|uniref:DMT family transporter n=1 Tax=Olsenella absiana TaxID=3115222 RepID=A0ABU7R728_9ACTN